MYAPRGPTFTCRCDGLLDQPGIIEDGLDLLADRSHGLAKELRELPQAEQTVRFSMRASRHKRKQHIQTSSFEYRTRPHWNDTRNRRAVRQGARIVSDVYAFPEDDEIAEIAELIRRLSPSYLEKLQKLLIKLVDAERRGRSKRSRV
jgi:aminopeptidase N